MSCSLPSSYYIEIGYTLGYLGIYYIIIGVYWGYIGAIEKNMETTTVNPFPQCERRSPRPVMLNIPGHGEIIYG